MNIFSSLLRYAPQRTAMTELVVTTHTTTSTHQCCKIPGNVRTSWKQEAKQININIYKIRKCLVIILMWGNQDTATRTDSDENNQISHWLSNMWETKFQVSNFHFFRNVKHFKCHCTWENRNLTRTKTDRIYYKEYNLT